MNKLNHLMTYESFKTNEEFNPLKKEDWKKAGGSVRRGVGFLTPEEEEKEGQKIVFSNQIKRDIYEDFADENPAKAKQYLIFWGRYGDNGNPVWNGSKFIDTARHFGSNAGVS